MMTMMLRQRLCQFAWTVATYTIGLRRLGNLLQRHILPSAYQDTIFYFDNGDHISNIIGTSSDDHSKSNNDITNPYNGYLALTIDDGISRGGKDSSMVPQIVELFKRYDAHATFFVCTDYVNEDDIRLLLQNGHEIGNHMKRDVSGYYFKLSQEEFQNELRECNDILNTILDRYFSDKKNEIEEVEGTDHRSRRKIRWFRPPQGIMTNAMRNVIEIEGLQCVLGDCYCDDWAFADDTDRDRDASPNKNTDSTISSSSLQATTATEGRGSSGNSNGDESNNNKNKNKLISNHVVPLMLKQIDDGNALNSGGRCGGSIAIFHMPEHGFRHGCYRAIEEFLQGISHQEGKGRNLRCITLSEMSQLGTRGRGACSSPTN